MRATGRGLGEPGCILNVLFGVVAPREVSCNFNLKNTLFLSTTPTTVLNVCSDDDDHVPVGRVSLL